MKAYFIYDKREEHVYQEFEAQLDAAEREEAQQSERITDGNVPNLPQLIENRNSSQESNQFESPGISNSEYPGGMLRSSMRDWDIRSRHQLNNEEQRDSPPNKDSQTNSAELNEVEGRKRVESFEIDFAGMSRSNSSGSVSDVPYPTLNEKLFLRSFDNLNKAEEKGIEDNPVDSTSTQLSSLALPPLRPRGRSTENKKGNSPYLPPNNRTSLKPIDERDDEHHHD